MVCGNGVYAMTTRSTSSVSAIGFRSLVIAALAVGCGSSTTNNNAPNSAGNTSVTTGGTAGTDGGTTSGGGTTGTKATGGAPNSVGGGANATGGSPGAATGGAANATGGAAANPTGGAAANPTGGAATDVGGSGNATGGAATMSTGGSTSTCNPPVTTLCTGTTPPAALISDFSIASGATAPSLFGIWSQSVYGGTYVYPATVASPGPCDTVSNYPLTQDLTGGNWHVQGTVGTYSGLGLWWQCNTGTTTTPAYVGSCVIDASAYTGISFTVSGSVGPVSSGTGTVGLTMQVSTPSTMKPALDSANNPKNCGTCTGSSCGTNVTVPVTTTATTVTMTWTQLGVTTPAAIAAISFAFTDPCSLNSVGYTTSPCTATTYPVDITIDNLQFTTN